MIAATIKLTSNLLFKWEYFPLLAILLVFGEYVLCTLIIHKIPYTEIDWRAYMQEVEGPFVHNDWNYTNLGGRYRPACVSCGVCLYLRRYETCGRLESCYGRNKPREGPVGDYDRPVDIQIYIYSKPSACSCHVWSSAPEKYATMGMYFDMPVKTNTFIFVLRLFNDGIAMGFLYAALLLFTKQRWTLGCILFSIAFSVKMNIILFAPALFLLLLKATGIVGTVMNIVLCAVIQVLLGLPFMMEDFWGYINGSFELGRVFKFKWTVNWKFYQKKFFRI